MWTSGKSQVTSNLLPLAGPPEAAQDYLPELHGHRVSVVIFEIYLVTVWPINEICILNSPLSSGARGQAWKAIE